MKKITILLLSMMLAGCVSPTILKPIRGVRLSDYLNISITTVDGVGTYYSQECSELLAEMLKSRMKSLGYIIVDKPTNDTLQIEIKLTKCTAGNAALRFWVGFGAGKAVLEYCATFKTGTKMIGQFSGGKAYTNMELVDNSFFKNERELQLSMVGKSVDQIEEYIKSDGRCFEFKRPDCRRKYDGSHHPYYHQQATGEYF